MSTAVLDYLFPAPSLPKSALSPSHFPGISPESTQTLQEVLKDNHVKWHVFYNEEGFHKYAFIQLDCEYPLTLNWCRSHAAHRALAAWSLGAGPSDISSGYEMDCVYEKPAIKSPQPITFNNFEEHLADDQYAAIVSSLTHVLNASPGTTPDTSDSSPSLWRSMEFHVPLSNTYFRWKPTSALRRSNPGC